MRTLIADSNKRFGSTVTSRSMILKALLACGIVSLVFYAAMDVMGGTRWQNDSWISQEFNRQSAIGAPARPVILALNPIYSLLVVAFGLGVWWSAGRKRAWHLVGGGLVVYGLVRVVWQQFFLEDLTKIESLGAPASKLAQRP